MNKSLLSVNQSGINYYVIRSNPTILKCSRHKTTPFVLQDALTKESWESFSDSSLPIYFKRGVERLGGILDKFTNLEEPLSAEIENQLPFMLESLIYVRHLIEQTNT